MSSKKTRLISVEVMIKTDAGPLAYIESIEKSDYFINKGSDDTYKHKIYFEFSAQDDANQIIMNACQFIKNLPVAARKIWDGAAFREFYIGYEVGETPHWYPDHYSALAVKHCAELGAGIGIALYPAVPTDEDGNPVD